MRYILNNTPKKAQALLSDFSFSVYIFLIIVALLSFSLYEIQKTNLENKKINDISEILDYLDTYFTQYEGNPKNWNLSTVEVFGAAKQPNIIDSNKIAMLQNLTYAEFLGKISWQYDEKIYIYGVFNNNTQYFEYGLKPENEKYVYVKRKLVYVEPLNKSILVIYHVWK